eukprot:COSAG06_NODE_26063_length_622_cov_1.852772_2_plen_48_part_01
MMTHRQGTTDQSYPQELLPQCHLQWRIIQPPIHYPEHHTQHISFLETT